MNPLPRRPAPCFLLLPSEWGPIPPLRLCLRSHKNHSFFPNATRRGERSGRGSTCGLAVSTAQPPGGACAIWPVHFAGHRVQVQATLRAAAPAKQRLCFPPEAALPLPPCPTGDTWAPPLGPGVGCGLCAHSHGGCFSSRADPAGLYVRRQGCVSSG